MRWLRRPGVLLGLALLSCDGGGTPREWTAADHDQPGPERPAKPVRPSGAPERTAATAARSGAEGAWRSFCARCHGLTGRGDGPEGADVGAADLTRTQWQAATTDAQIAAVITGGKGKMPPFQLPPAMTALLVRHVRELGRAADAGATAARATAAATTAPAAPSPSAATAIPTAPSSRAAEAPGR